MHPRPGSAAGASSRTASRPSPPTARRTRCPGYELDLLDLCDSFLTLFFQDYPYLVTNTDQYALDDILTTRFIDYSHSVALLSTPAPDFIFLPVLSQIYSNPWGCQDPDLIEGIKQTTNYIRQIVASVGPTEYPRIILPVATIRSNLERDLFLPELMEELKDSVVVVSIEGAPKSYKEGMKYMIDVPCEPFRHPP